MTKSINVGLGHLNRMVPHWPTEHSPKTLKDKNGKNLKGLLLKDTSVVLYILMTFSRVPLENLY